MTSNQKLAQNSRGEIDFELEAVVAKYIGLDSRGAYIDSLSGLEVDEVLKRFSLLKYGHLASIRYFAIEICKMASKSIVFKNFLTTARDNNETVFITSPGIYNVPSASNVLLKESVSLLNVMCSIEGMPPIKIMEQARLEESCPNYAKSSIKDRQSANQTENVIPSIFKGRSVIYIDDVYISGTVAECAKKRLIEEAGANSVFFLFGMKIDKEVVQSTDGKVEDKLNRYLVDGTLDGLSNVISDDFTTTQKTLRDLLIPENQAGLSTYLSKLKPRIALKLYIAAMQNGFRERWNGIYSGSVDILENHLIKTGLIGSDRLISDKYIILNDND